MRAAGSAAAAIILCALYSGHGRAALNEAPLAVIGELRLQTTQSNHTLMVRVEDESGNALGGVRIEVLSSQATSCDGAGQPVQTTGADGTACFHVDGAPLSQTTLIASKQHYSEAKWQVDLERTDPPPEIVVFPRLVNLDRAEQHAVEIARARAGPLQLTLRCNQRIINIYQAEARASERLKLGLPTSSFRQALGSCDLIVSTSGLSSHPVPLNIVTTPELSLEGVEVKRDRIIVSIRVASSAGPLSLGLVEASGDGVLSRTANVRDGRARLEFSKEEAGRSLVVHYLPANVGFPRGSALPLELPHLAASGAVHLWLSLPLVVFAVWLMKRFLDHGPRRSRSRPRSGEAPSTAAPPRFPVDQDLHGIVFDLDTHERLSGALVELFRLEATQRVSMGRTESDRDGSFRFPHSFGGQPNYEIVCAARGYRTVHTRPEGPAVRVGVIAERRALLRALVRWARSNGWWIKDSQNIPTPLEVAGRARLEGRVEVQAWAERVNSRVYGTRENETSEDVPEDPSMFDALR